MSSYTPKPAAQAPRFPLIRPPSWSRITVREKPEPEANMAGEDGLTMRLAENAKRGGVGAEVMHVLSIITQKTAHGSAARLNAIWTLNDLVEHETPSRLPQALGVCISLMPHSSEPSSFLRALISAEQLFERSMANAGQR